MHWPHCWKPTEHRCWYHCGVCEAPQGLTFFLLIQRCVLSGAFVQKNAKAKPSLVILSLLIIGELGRFMFVFHPILFAVFLLTFFKAICQTKARISTWLLSTLALSKKRRALLLLSLLVMSSLAIFLMPPY